MQDTFTLHVAAQTTDETGNPATSATWSEADAAWSVNFNGTLGGGPKYIWTGDVDARVNPPDPNGWQIVEKPEPLKTDLPIGNEVVAELKWTSSQLPKK